MNWVHQETLAQLDFWSFDAQSVWAARHFARHIINSTWELDCKMVMWLMDSSVNIVTCPVHHFLISGGHNDLFPNLPFIPGGINITPGTGLPRPRFDPYGPLPDINQMPGPHRRGRRPGPSGGFPPGFLWNNIVLVWNTVILEWNNVILVWNYINLVWLKKDMILWTWNKTSPEVSGTVLQSEYGSFQLSG